MKEDKENKKKDIIFLVGLVVFMGALLYVVSAATKPSV